MFVDHVSAIIRQVGTAEVVSRFQALTQAEVMEKSPGDLVTIADQECERVLAERLRAVRDIPVVGEEATAADPALLDVVDTADAAWIVDPIDGTSNFVAGNPDFAVMVALAEKGTTTAAWVWHPETDIMLTAQRGQGLQRNGVAATAATRSRTPQGILKRKYMPEPARTRLADFPTSVATLLPDAKSAGIEYGRLIEGGIDFVMYWRTLPWDHAPGALLATEAGMRSARLDGSTYRPGDGQKGLLTAAEADWEAIAVQIRLALAD